MCCRKISKVLLLLFLFAGVPYVGNTAGIAQDLGGRDTSMEAIRTSPQDAYREVISGKALLVCAYQDEAVCAKMLLQGAISLKTFETKLPQLSKDQPIIFYCA